MVGLGIGGNWHRHRFWNGLSVRRPFDGKVIPGYHVTDGAIAYDRWLRGECFCCGQRFGDSDQTEHARPVAEGVVMCGSCAESEHDDDKPRMRTLLAGMAEMAIRAHAHVPLSERE